MTYGPFSESPTGIFNHGCRLMLLGELLDSETDIRAIDELLVILRGTNERDEDLRSAVNSAIESIYREQIVRIHEDSGDEGFRGAVLKFRSREPE